MNGSGIDEREDSPLYLTFSFILAVGLIAVGVIGRAYGWWDNEMMMALIAAGLALIAKRRTDQRKLRELRRQTRLLEEIRR